MAAIIEIEGLRKEYRRRRGVSVAVDSLDLSVPAGGVFGFLGPNGSGKTTTIRCLLGLVRPTAGSMRIFGQPVPESLGASMRRIGAIVESPALFPSMTGRENLRLLAKIDGIGNTRVDEVLEQVGLAARSRDAVRTYSLGMRQRLGLGAALLKDPELLILDEPANGLDPAGIREVRELLRRLGAEGRTIFVSSHQLSEVEQTCDAVAILRRGSCVATGSVAEVMASASSGQEGILIKAADSETAAAVLRRAGFTPEPVNGHLRVLASASQASEINQLLGTEGIWVSELRPDEQRLEDLFLEITRDPPVDATLNGHGTYLDTTIETGART